VVTVFLLAAGAGPAPAADPILLGEIDSRTTSSPSTGVDLTLLAITLDVRGGVGRVGGLLAAGLALGLVEGLTLATVGSGSRELGSH
jgi:branched-subunit amino acid ABC-type transport system permease component